MAVGVKPTPLIVTFVPGAPTPGFTEVIANVMASFALLVALPWAVVTVTLALLAPAGIVTSSSAAEITVKLAASFPTLTEVAVSSAVPSRISFEPVIAEVGLKPVTLSASEATGPTVAESALPGPVAGRTAATGHE